MYHPARITCTNVQTTLKEHVATGMHAYEVRLFKKHASSVCEYNHDRSSTIVNEQCHMREREYKIADTI